MELVSAKNETGRRRAVTRLSGALYSEINELKKSLVGVLSAAELFLDYSEDEIGEVASVDNEESAGRLPSRNIALAVLAQLKKLGKSWEHERIYQEGIPAVIAGRPNAGKSSLFNLLLKEDRSIVTDTPGTTRDWIEAWVSIEGLPVRLIDTAGLRDSSGASIDTAEQIGMERSRKLLDEADLILYLIDGAQGVTREDREFCEKYGHKPLIVLWNKCDIAAGNEKPDIINFSVKTGEGLEELHAAIGNSVRARSAGQMAETDLQTTALGSLRQRNLVDAACAALKEALFLADNGEPLDIIAPLLREAVDSLGTITGEVSTADILDEMFSAFCVGK
jgi:tRNA modification GTPase